MSANVETTAVEFGPAEAGTPRRGPWRQAARRFRRRPLGVAALTLLVAIFVTGVLADKLAPYPAGEEFLEF
ncbi:MAG: hypothetical protein ACJ75Q_01535, partial [Gaiellaceae bacterium]